jgi:hypothetical protein
MSRRGFKQTPTTSERLLRRLKAFLASIAILAPALLLYSPGAPAQGSQKSDAANQVPARARARAFDPHDLSGVWEHEGIGGSIASGPVSPMTPWGQAKFDAAKPGFGPRRVPPTEDNDPVLICDPQGFPRAMSLENPEPMEFIQIRGRILQFMEWNHNWRTIWIDGRDLPKVLEATWYGYSVGKWEGDTLAVKTSGLDERTWLDPLGHPHSDALRVEEHYHRANRDTMEFTMKVDDPKAYTRPWMLVQMKVLKLNPKYEIQEAICAPSDEKNFNKDIRIPADTIGTAK